MMQRTASTSRTRARRLLRNYDWVVRRQCRSYHRGTTLSSFSSLGRSNLHNNTNPNYASAVMTSHDVLTYSSSSSLLFPIHSTTRINGISTSIGIGRSSTSNSGSRRLFWSSPDFAKKAVKEAETEAEAEATAAAAATSPTSSLPVPPITPSNLSTTTSILPNSTIESLLSLPECQMVLDLLNGSNNDNASDDGNSNNSISNVAIIEPATVKEAHSNLKRARDILQSIPELQLATYLLEVDLLVFCGKFDLALETLARYEHSKKTNAASTAIDDANDERKKIQFARAKLSVHSGQFGHALSEYEDLLEDMEEEVERQMERQMERMERMERHMEKMQRQEEEGKSLTEEESDDDDIDGGDVGNRLPVIHGAAAMNGLGVTKLLLHVREEGSDRSSSSSGGSDNTHAVNEIIESMETATEMLLESRKEALESSTTHARLAVDLGLAASISLTNLGVAHSLLSSSNNDSDISRKNSMECWERGVETLDDILRDAMNSAIIIPNWVIQCMESVRARLYCNMSWTLLGFDRLEENNGGKLEDVSDETLKEASEAAKKALDISDELINGSKLMREYADKTTSDDAKEGSNDDDDASDDSTNNDTKPKEQPLSPLWASYHRAESARALGLVAQCYASAGAAVTAEGLFQSAMDASSSYPLGQSFNNTNNSDNNGGGKKGVSLSSPNLGLVARDVRLGYAVLCDGWEKRKGDAERLRSDALRIEKEGVLKGYGRGGGEDGKRVVSSSVSGLESSLWLFSPLDFER